MLCIPVLGKDLPNIKGTDLALGLNLDDIRYLLQIFRNTHPA